jgi:hypothetical protein
MKRKYHTSIYANEAKRTGLFFLLLFVFTGCYRDNETSLYPRSAAPGSVNCDTVNLSYSHTIQQIFLQNCALPGCHASSAATGGYKLDNYSGVKSIVLSGRIIGAITHTVGYASMPKDAAMLSECQIGQIESWINQGAQNN